MRRWACSDIHGNKEIWNKIKNTIDEDDLVLFLGDAIDRGEYGWEILKEMLEDKRFKMLKGNHEDMMVKALYDEEERWLPIWYANGGWPTYDKAYFDPDMLDVLAKVKELPTSCSLINNNDDLIFFSHSGAGYWDNLDVTPYDQIWDRKHYLTPSDDRYSYVIHGHTPFWYIAEDLNMTAPINGALWYDNGHKCCIDMGTYSTGQCVLMDLDTFEQILISCKEDSPNGKK